MNGATSLKGYSAQQIRDAEAPHLAAGEPLMARAAAALARECERMLHAEGLSLHHARVFVLVGGGNNGGDALYAVAALATKGVTVEVVRTSTRVHEDALAAAVGAGAKVIWSASQKGATVPAPPADAASPAALASPAARSTPPAEGVQLADAHARQRLAAQAASADLIVDGILGTGTSPEPQLRGDARELVAAIVAARRSTPVVAVDIPSGIHPDTGAVPEPGAVLRADVTVTFGGCKAGLLREPASAFAGEIRLIDIGLAAQLDALTPLIARSRAPERPHTRAAEQARRNAP